jgi:hypothetical protein
MAGVIITKNRSAIRERTGQAIIQVSKLPSDEKRRELTSAPYAIFGIPGRTANALNQRLAAESARLTVGF